MASQYHCNSADHGEYQQGETEVGWECVASQSSQRVIGIDGISRLEVGMADAEMTKGRVPGDQGRCNAKIVIQDLDVIRRRLFLVLVHFPPYALERKKRSTKILQISSFLDGSSDECYFGTFIYSYRLVRECNKKGREKRTWSSIYDDLSR